MNRRELLKFSLFSPLLGLFKKKSEDELDIEESIDSLKEPESKPKYSTVSPSTSPSASPSVSLSAGTESDWRWVPCTVPINCVDKDSYLHTVITNQDGIVSDFWSKKVINKQ